MLAGNEGCGSVGLHVVRYVEEGDDGLLREDVEGREDVVAGVLRVEERIWCRVW